MRVKSAVLLIGAWAVAFNVAEGQQTAFDSLTWHTYRNAKYGYEIGYPSGFEVWPTGPAGERDGRAIRIGRREYAAPVPVLDIRVQTQAPAVEPPVDAELPDMDVTVGEVKINGVRATEVTYRWKTTGDIAFVNLHLRDAFIEFHAQPGLRDVRETVWWRIISTFSVRDG